MFNGKEGNIVLASGLPRVRYDWQLTGAQTRRCACRGALMPAVNIDKSLALVSLALQVLLMATAFGAVYLAKKRDLRRHCTIMRVAISLQVLTIAGVMLPSMISFLQRGERGLFFNVELLTHHTLGLAVVGLWVYINLVVMGVVKMRGRLANVMRLALVLWVLAFFIGLHTYVQAWLV